MAVRTAGGEESVNGRKTWVLIGTDGQPYRSNVPGALGGHRGTRIYGLLSCRAAQRAIEKGGYVRHRVFFRDEATAIAAGYRPCAVCMPETYAAWKAARHTGRAPAP